MDEIVPGRTLGVVYRPIGELRPDPRNARPHPKRQLDQIIASIREFGYGKSGREIKRCTRDADSLRWPRGTDE